MFVATKQHKLLSNDEPLAESIPRRAGQALQKCQGCPMKWSSNGGSARVNPSKVIQSTSFGSKMPGDPWHGLLPCRDQGLIPVGFAMAVQPCSVGLTFLTNFPASCKHACCLNSEKYAHLLLQNPPGPLHSSQTLQSAMLQLQTAHLAWLAGTASLAHWNPAIFTQS